MTAPAANRTAAYAKPAAGLRVNRPGAKSPALKIPTPTKNFLKSLGANFTLASSEGYDLNAQALELGRQIASASGRKITLLRDPHEAVKNASVIYTDTWTSMGPEAEAKKREASINYGTNRLNS